jgi:hypothetical protein
MPGRAETLAPVVKQLVQFRPCRLRRDAVFQPRDDMQGVGAAVPSRIRVDPERQPDFGAVVHDVGAGRHDSDDFVGPALDFHRLSD